MGEDLFGHEPQVVEVGQVEHLEVEPLGASGGKCSQLVQDFRRCARQAVLAEIRNLSANNRCPPGDFCISPAATEHLAQREDKAGWVTPELLTTVADRIMHTLHCPHGDERHVELVRISGRQPCVPRAAAPAQDNRRVRSLRRPERISL